MSAPPRPFARVRRRGWVAAGLLAAALGLAPAAASAPQTPPSDRGPVPVAASDLEGLTLVDVIGGELRLVHARDGDRLSLGSLRLDPDRRQPPRRATWRLPAVEPCALLAPFERSRTNRLGGTFATWSREPSHATADLVERHDERFLRFDYWREAHGWGGLRIDLLDDEPSDRTLRYLDASDRQAFVLRVRGDLEGLRVGLADEGWRERGDAVDLGALDRFVQGDADPRGWRLARVPVRASQLDAGRLARLTLEASAGSGSLEIDDLWICTDGAQPPPTALPEGPGASPAPRSLWVWSTRAVAGTSDGGRQLATFARETGIDRVYLQLPGPFLDPQHAFDPADDPVGLRPLLRTLHAAGVEPWALDGAADYALPDRHDRVVESVRRLAAWSAAGAPSSAFDGLHLDVEPYLLPEWERERETVIDGFLDLYRRVRDATHRASLPLEAAIPFWFDGVPAPASEAGRPVARSLFDALSERVDAVVIMDYRTDAAGSNGLLALAETELELASARGQRVLIALETGPLPDETRLRFRGRGRRGLPNGPGSWVLASESPTPRLWLLEPDDPLPAEARAEPERWLHWPVDQRVEIPAARQTFHGGESGAFQTVLAEAERALRVYPSFAGFALHHYEPLRRLLEGESGSR